MWFSYFPIFTIQDINVELKDYGRLRKDSELKIQSHDNPNKKVG